MSTLSSNLLFDFENDIYAKAKEDREVEFQEDPLVLSCLAKEIVEQGGGWRSFSDERLLELVTVQNRSRADDIRKYFSKKFFWKNLQNNRPLSPFRQKTLFLLETKSKVIKEKDIGIFFKLPYFYEEDQVYERFKKELKVDEDFANRDRAFYQEQLRSVVYLDKTVGWQGKEKVVRFWFKDSDQWLYNFVILEKNPLKEFFTDFVESKKEHKFVCRLSTSRIEDMNFYVIVNPKNSKE
jgi:hypothetical protein